jgi:hypothetical protein
MTFGPTHPVTRLDRVLQQLRSFADLHAAELDALATELDSAAPDTASRLRSFRSMQTDESQIVIDELADIRAELGVSESAPVLMEPEVMKDPAVDSPKRARWLAEQAARDEALRRPRSRRHLLGGVPHPPPSVPPSTPEV